ncbi:MAG TPA: R3H domain-containing nucleic acid-binding protein [Candidatus Saccharimonadales bacterium]|nr:R3H domain-containing nucleic acid-binding protein [Candidatus Saccharimonadales bacterium]
MDRIASIDYAKKYLEDLLSFFGLNTVITAHCDEDEDVIELTVPSTHLNGFLIGQRGETLRSLQFLLSMSLKNQDAELTRVNIDVANYKRHRAERIADQVREWCEQVMQSGEPMDLKPMSPADRRTAHRVVAEFGQLESHSEGEGCDRHLVITKKVE